MSLTTDQEELLRQLLRSKSLYDQALAYQLEFGRCEHLLENLGQRLTILVDSIGADQFAYYFQLSPEAWSRNQNFLLVQLQVKP